MSPSAAMTYDEVVERWLTLRRCRNHASDGGGRSRATGQRPSTRTATASTIWDGTDKPHLTDKQRATNHGPRQPRSELEGSYREGKAGAMTCETIWARTGVATNRVGS